MNSSSTSTSTSSVLQSGFATRTLPAFAAAVFGLVLLLGAGLASPDFLHNATHDARHALGLPCH